MLDRFYVLNNLSNEIYDSNLKKGWWNNIETGEDMTDNPYMQATKLALIHSEVSEALEGLRRGGNDDKLSQYTNEAVELADVFIRLFDYCGAKKIPIGSVIVDKINYNAQREDHEVGNRKKVSGKKF